MTPLAVYVHIPFCTVKCGYCDFNAYAGMDALKDDYALALVRELRGYADVLATREVGTVFFGGGTPGEMPAESIAGVLGALGGLAHILPDAEVSLEANPGTTSLGSLERLRTAGVTRLSFGVQSFDPAELRFLDRIHTPEAAETAVRLARRAGFASVSVDLIFGLPGQAGEAWTRSLSRAIALAPDHVSCYALTVEEGTPLGRHVVAGRVTPLDEDAVADLYERGSALLEAAGYRQYEISSWAQPGHASRHNQVYWTDGDYLAIGAGAHGYLGGERYENIAHPRAYLASLVGEAAGRPARANAYRSAPAVAMADWVTLALRRTDGFSPAAFERRFGESLDACLGPVLMDCEAAGVLECRPAVRLTRRGRLLHGEVATRVFVHLRAA